PAFAHDTKTPRIPPLSDPSPIGQFVSSAVSPAPNKTLALRRILAELPVVVARLVAKGSLQEIREARITTETLRGHAARAKLGKEAQDTCAVARLRLERRLGEVLPP